MSKNNDRLDMLKKLSLLDKSDNLDIFKSYIPGHYDEIYSMYTLLVESKVDYNDIDFDEPSENNDGSFNIKFNCGDSVLKKLKKFFNNEKDTKTIKYLRKNSFSVSLSIDDIYNDCINVIISFNKI